MLENYKCDGKIKDNEFIIYWLKAFQTKNTNEFQKEFCRMRRKIIQNIARYIKVLITEIDEELEPFCFKISEYGAQMLHLIA